mgnify:CR=1 FL=1
MSDVTYLRVHTMSCGCGRTRLRGQSHCFCDYEYDVLGIVPTFKLTLKDKVREVIEE